MYKSIKKDLKRKNDNIVNTKIFIKGNRKEEEEDSYYYLSMNIDLSTDTCSNYEDSHTGTGNDFYGFLISKLNISKINGIDLNLYTSYTDTTFYDRANFTYTSEGEEVNNDILVCGDIITIPCEHFNFYIYVSEVKLENKDTVTSKIPVSFTENVPNFTILSDDKLSLIKDCNGNCYSMKANLKVQDLLDYLEYQRNIYPSNASKPDGSINPWESEHLHFDLESNKLKYSKFTDSLEPEVYNGGFINPSELPSSSQTQTLKDFKCKIKGYFGFYRSLDNPSTKEQFANYEIYDYNEISYDSTESKLKLPFLECDLDNNEVKLVKDANYTGPLPFNTFGGFYIDNLNKTFNISETPGIKIFSPTIFVEKNN